MNPRNFVKYLFHILFRISITILRMFHNSLITRSYTSNRNLGYLKHPLELFMEIKQCSQYDQYCNKCNIYIEYTIPGKMFGHIA